MGSALPGRADPPRQNRPDPEMPLKLPLAAPAPAAAPGSPSDGENILAWLSRFCCRLSKVIHKYLGLLLLIYFFAMGASGLLLNNPGLISGFSVPWSLTPANYEPRAWNRMYLRGGTINGDDWFLAGKPGVVHSADGGRTFTILAEGFAPSPYGRDTMGLLVRPGPAGYELLAATRAGLYQRYRDQPWQRLELPGAGRNPVVEDVIATPKLIVAFTQQGLYVAPVPAAAPPGADHNQSAESRTGPEYQFTAIEPEISGDYHDLVPWFRILHDIHKGRIIGSAGKWLLDLLALGLIFLALSSLVIWYVPWRNRRIKRWRRKPGRLFNFCWPYHLKIGIYTVAFLALLAVTGALLRPPLLIAVAPYSLERDHPLLALSPRSNDWGGKPQQALYSSASDTILVATEGGFFQGPADFSAPFQPRLIPVPIHGMGVTVLEEVEPGLLLIGSFMGLYLWEEFGGRVERLPRPGLRGGNPYMGNDLVTGAVMADGRPRFRVDYHDGLLPIVPQMAGYGPPMPAGIIANTPMSLWHYLFEFHNGRIFEQWLGMGYLLIIPAGGASLLLLAITGLFDWLYRRLG